MAHASRFGWYAVDQEEHRGNGEGYVEPLSGGHGGIGADTNWRTVQQLAHATGHSAVVEFVPQLTREDRRSLALHHAIAAKLRHSPTEVLVLARRNVRRLSKQHPGAGDLLNEWKAILRTHPETIAAVMTHPGRRARELRYVTPFAGVLTPSERAAVYRQFRRDETAA